MQSDNMEGVLPLPQNINGNRIALFGLSANPPTGLSGHLGIVRYLVQTGLFDEVWALPVYQHMFAAKRLMEPFDKRIAMCRACMDSETTSKCKVRVMEIERQAAEYYLNSQGQEYRVGTVDVLDLIRKSRKDLNLHLIVGTDTYKDLIQRKWKQSDRILSMVTVHAISRKGVETTGIDCPTDSCLIRIASKAMNSSETESLNVKVVHHKVPWLEEVSSTVVRKISSTLGIDLDGLVTVRCGQETETAGNGDQSHEEHMNTIKGLLDPRVLTCIISHNLYGYTRSRADSITENEGVVGQIMEGDSAKRHHSISQIGPIDVVVVENKLVESIS